MLELAGVILHGGTAVCELETILFQGGNNADEITASAQNHERFFEG
jgi:hypothetical protein